MYKYLGVPVFLLAITLPLACVALTSYNMVKIHTKSKTFTNLRILNHFMLNTLGTIMFFPTINANAAIIEAATLGTNNFGFEGNEGNLINVLFWIPCCLLTYFLGMLVCLWDYNPYQILAPRYKGTMAHGKAQVG
jgi:hypothetical protein